LDIHGVMSKKYICHCFKYTREALEEDARKHGRSTIMEEIMAASRDGVCNCINNNPTGS
jgi:hypothetical protein